MQGGKQNANETKGNGKSNPCRWMFKNQEGSHKNYIHPTKPGKVTIPFHKKDLPIGTEKSIKKQAGLNSPTACPFNNNRRCVKCYQCIQPVSFMRKTAIL